MLDPEEKRLLSENNKLLHKLTRAQNWSTFFSVFRWMVVVGAALGAYYYLQPYLEQVIGLYKNLPIKPF